jgi:glutathionylspermidine synthase
VIERLRISPRDNWRDRVERSGLSWHGADGGYWNESAYYRLTARDVDTLEKATAELHAMCLKAVEHVIENDLFARMQIPELARPLIRESWEKEPPSLYGRFDLAYDGSGCPKMLEYNADTPTAILEAAVIQWDWLQDRFPKADQFNSIHERLMDVWKYFSDWIPGGRIDFCSADTAEDSMTIAYLADTAAQAGYEINTYPISEIGWNGAAFISGASDQPAGVVFKLYPWEWMLAEEFGRHIASAGTLWIEPAWKMVLSNKAILPILWNLFPRSPLLLEARFDAPLDYHDWVKKPIHGREGANVTVLSGARVVEQTGGDYGERGFIYQRRAALPEFAGKRPVFGSWIIGQEPAGVGIREASGWITGNTSKFVPHLFEP